MSALAFAVDSSSSEDDDNLELEVDMGEGNTILSSMSKDDQEAMEKADAVKELTEREIANEKRRALFSANPKKRLRKLNDTIEAQTQWSSQMDTTATPQRCQLKDPQS